MHMCFPNNLMKRKTFLQYRKKPNNIDKGISITIMHDIIAFMFRYDGDLQNAWDWRTVRLYYNTTAQAEFDNTEHKCRVFFGESSNSGVRPASFETSCTDIYRSRRKSWLHNYLNPSSFRLNNYALHLELFNTFLQKNHR